MTTPSSCRLRTLLFLFLVLACPLVGCSDQGPQDGLLGPLESARNRWNGARLDRYSYELRRSCDCPPEMTGPVTVLVEGLTPTDWTYGDGTPVPEGYRADFPSVDGLLDMLEDGIRRGAWEINVQYDQETGVPLLFRIDYDQLVFGEEASYRVLSLPRVPGT